MEKQLENLTSTQRGLMLLNEVAYQLVVETAPEELPLYVETRDRFLADPEGFTRSSQSTDEVLGIGEVAVITTFTAVVLPVVASVLNYVVEQVMEALQDELSEEAVQWVRGLFSQSVAPKPIFTQEQLDVIATTIREIATTEAERLGVEVNQASIISDRIIVQLVLAKK